MLRRGACTNWVESLLGLGEERERRAAVFATGKEAKDGGELAAVAGEGAGKTSQVCCQR